MHSTYVTRVLLVEDNPGDADRIREALSETSSGPFEIEHVQRLAQALSRLAEARFAVVLLDLSLPDCTGLESLDRVQASCGETPIVVLSGLAVDTVALDAVRRGAEDYLFKGHADEVLLPRALLYAIERRRGREALRRSEESFRQLIEHASDAIFVANLDGQLTDVNAAGCQLLGYARAEIVGKHNVDFLRQEDIGRLAATKELVSRGGAEVAEWVLKRKDGDFVPVEVSTKVLPDGRWVGLARDITERERAEAALRFSEAKFAGIVSTSADAILCIDEAQRITVFNEGAEKIFGYSKAEALGAPLDLLLPERMRAVHRRHVEDFADSPDSARLMGARRVPIIGRCKNGEEFPADVAISKFDIRGTKVFTAVLRDISVQKRAENEQRLLAEAGVVLVSASIDDPHAALTGIAPIAVKTFADYCVVDLVEESEQARSFRRLKVAASGSAKVDLAERLCRVPLNWDRPLLSAKAIQTRRSELVPEISSGFLESRAQGEEHLRLLREIAPRSLIVVPLIAREELCGSISFLSCQPGRRYGPDDVRVAEELAWRAALSYDNARLYQAAQRAIRNRDQALGVVAHDLRNPLGAIILRASTLLCHPKGEVNRRRNGALDAILRAAERMNRMIEDLLDIHRIEAGKLATEFCPHSAKALVVDAVESARPLTRTLDLTLDLQDDLPYVWADRERVQQVFSNLIGNAIKFTGQEGRISIGAKRSGDAVCFWVADTGSGIAEAELPHIFDRFWQAKRADKRGAGLGLPICKGIIEAHDGRIWAESKRGMGSTFFFTIPVAREKGVQLSEPAPPPPEPHG